jgi:hypothetical protein
MSRIQSFNDYNALGGASAYDVITITSVASQLTAIPAGCNAVTFTVTANASTSGDAIYMTLNTQTPSASAGLALRDGAVVQLFMDEVKAVRFVSADGNDQTIRIEFAKVS